MVDITTTIRIKKTTKEILESLKIIPEEPMDRLIRRVILTSSLTGGTI